MAFECSQHGFFPTNFTCPQCALGIEDRCPRHPHLIKGPHGCAECRYEKNAQTARSLDKAATPQLQRGAGADFAKALTGKNHPYHALATVLLSAYEQAAMGKGKERHAQERPFTEQPMQTISDLVGDHNGLAYQAIKKIQESQRLPHDRAIAELRGAIVYTAGNVIYREKNHG